MSQYRLPAFFLLIILGLQASAQQTTTSAPQTPGKDTTTVRQMEEIIVTADKTESKLSQTGKLVTVITKDQLERSGGKNLAQVLNEQAGIVVGGAGSNRGLNKSIYIEGAGNGYTLILRDGVPLQDASSIDNSLDLRNLTLDGVERIEIVKGSQSLLYGSDAIAGVINIITSKGSPKPVNLSAMGSYGTNNSWQGAAAISGQLHAIKYDAGYMYDHTDGIPEATDTIKGTASPRDGFTQHSFHANLDWQAKKGFSLSPFLVYSHANGSQDGGAFTVDTEYTYHFDNLQAGIRSLVQAGKAQLHLVYSFNRSSRGDLDDSLPSLATRGNYYSDAYTGYEHYAEGYVTYPINKNIQFLGGVDFRHLSTDQHSLDLYPDYNNPAITDTSVSALSKDSARYHQAGLYAAATASLPHGIFIDGGLRYNFNSRYGNSLVYNIDPSIALSNSWKIFANLSSGYKVPSLYQLYSPYGNKALKPEQAVSFEAGIQYTSPGGALRIRGTWFDRHLTDVIFFYTNPSTYVSQYINQNREKNQGVELEASWTIMSSLALTGYYTYVTGEVTDKSGNGGKDSTYANLFRVPKNSAGLSLGYQASKRIYIRSGLQWRDKRQDLYYDPNTYAEAQVTLRAYALWSAYAEYQLQAGNKHKASDDKGRFRLFIDLENITDTKYAEIYGYNTLGFTVTGGVRVQL